MKTFHKVTDTRVVRVHHNDGVIVPKLNIACKGAKGKQEEWGSSLSVDEIAEGDHADVAIPSLSLHTFR